MKNKYGLIVGLGVLASLSLMGNTIYNSYKDKLTKTDEIIFGVGAAILTATYAYGIDKNPNLMEAKKENKLEEEIRK